MPSIFYLGFPRRDDISISKDHEGRLYSRFGKIEAKGSEAEKLLFKDAKAFRDILLNYVEIPGQVRSKYGSLVAKHSALADVSVYNNILLSDSTAKKVTALFGSVALKDSKVENVVSAGKVGLERASVEGKVQACYDIALENSSASALSSDFGKITVKQTDGTRRTISQISAQGKIIAQGSTVQDVALHIDQDQKAHLDLTDTEVLGNIAVKVQDFHGTFYGNINGKEFHHPSAFAAYLRTGRMEDAEAAPTTKHFTLLIKGEEMPKNISFEGFETDEITSEKTADGILVSGVKRK